MTDKLFSTILQASRDARRLQAEHERQIVIRWLVILATSGFILIRMLGV